MERNKGGDGERGDKNRGRFFIAIKLIIIKGENTSTSFITFQTCQTCNFSLLIHNHLIIIATTQDLLPCRLKDNSMFILRREGSLDIHQRRVLLHNTDFHQVTKAQHILLFANSVQVTSAEG